MAKKSMEQMLDEWGSEVATPIPRKKKKKVEIPKSKLRLLRQKYLGTDKRGYILSQTLNKALGK